MDPRVRLLCERQILGYFGSPRTPLFNELSAHPKAVIMSTCKLVKVINIIWG
jgi:hypothetical protein